MIRDKRYKKKRDRTALWNENSRWKHPRITPQPLLSKIESIEKELNSEARIQGTKRDQKKDLSPKIPEISEVPWRKVAGSDKKEKKPSELLNDRWCTKCIKSDHWTSGCSLTRKSRTGQFRIRLVKEGNNFYDIRGNKWEIIPGEPKDNELWRKKFKLNASARKETKQLTQSLKRAKRKWK